jgi:predicted aspartyl protease
VTGPAGTKVVNLLVDTGSTYTIVPIEVLESIGLSPAESKAHERIATGSGYIIAPKLRVRTFNTLGKQIHHFYVIAHTLPFGGPIDGLLGTDILSRLKARIAVADGSIEVGR